jgi:erythromycin esterase
MPHAVPSPTVEAWIAKEALSFDLHAAPELNAAVDMIVARLGEKVGVLGITEPLHGGEAFPLLRNRVFERLVQAHGYTAIAVESCFLRGLVANSFALGEGPDDYAAIRDTGFSHGFGALEATRELVEWIRAYNADPAHTTKLHYYGFDMPGHVGGPSSPRQVLGRLLDYLRTFDETFAEDKRQAIETLIGNDAEWENPMPWRDPAANAPLLARLDALRPIAEEIIWHLRIREPQLAAGAGAPAYADAAQDAQLARGLLNFYSALAHDPGFADSLAVRDLMMADTLEYLRDREQRRAGGKLLVFAHNKHLQRGIAGWQMGPQKISWWPAGGYLAQRMGAAYAVIGTALGSSADNALPAPEAGTLEAALLATPGPARAVAIYSAVLPNEAERAATPVRSGTAKNPSYFALNPESFTDFDYLIAIDETTYNRGGRPLP